jgi:hypothetical protein
VLIDGNIETNTIPAYMGNVGFIIFSILVLDTAQLPSSIAPTGGFHSSIHKFNHLT